MLAWLGMWMCSRYIVKLIAKGTRYCAKRVCYEFCLGIGKTIVLIQGLEWSLYSAGIVLNGAYIRVNVCTRTWKFEFHSCNFSPNVFKSSSDLCHLQLFSLHPCIQICICSQKRIGFSEFFLWDLIDFRMHLLRILILTKCINSI